MGGLSPTPPHPSLYSGSSATSVKPVYCDPLLLSDFFSEIIQIMHILRSHDRAAFPCDQAGLAVSVKVDMTAQCRLPRPKAAM